MQKKKKKVFKAKVWDTGPALADKGALAKVRRTKDAPVLTAAHGVHVAVLAHKQVGCEHMHLFPTFVTHHHLPPILRRQIRRARSTLRTTSR
jgi:hypothetical protein